MRRIALRGALMLLVAGRASAQHVEDAAPMLARGWRPGVHQLGRGRMRGDRVSMRDSSFHLQLDAGRCDGAEIRTEVRHGFGDYSARMRTPRAPGSISALFLYADVPDGNDEIDIEIFNDASGDALLTTWVAGVRTREMKLHLGFDPGAAFHRYGLRWHRDELRFMVDDAVVGRMTEGFPMQPMRLMANAWWPVWRECAPLAQPADLVIDSLGIRPDHAPDGT